MFSQREDFAVHSLLSVIKVDWSVCTCLTQLYDDTDMYRIYYIMNDIVITSQSHKIHFLSCSEKAQLLQRPLHC